MYGTICGMDWVGQGVSEDSQGIERDATNVRDRLSLMAAPWQMESPWPGPHPVYALARTCALACGAVLYISNCG
jgi:hypothetical protein